MNFQIKNCNYIINYVIIITLVYLIYYYFVHKNNNEEYAPDRKRTDPQSDWNIVEEIRKLRKQQDNNINSYSEKRKNELYI